MFSTNTYAYAAVAFVVIGLGAGVVYQQTRDRTFADCGGGIATGAATVGGPFTLVSETGETVTSASVIDGPAMVYFGYTFCPDVCPVDAANMALATDLLTERGYSVKPIFVSIDPGRDTPQVMADYTENLHPDMLGLTGSDAQVAEAARAYKVYYAKSDSDDPEFYLMDHSAFIYLMDAGDRFLTVFRHGEPPETIAESAACYLDVVARGA